MDENIDSTYEQWKEYGDEIKHLKNEILRIRCNQKYNDLLRDQKIGDYLTKAWNNLSKFSNKAENKMFKKCQPDNDIKWLRVFYGNEDKDCE